MTLDRVIEELRRMPEPWDERELEKKMWRVLRPRVAVGVGVTALGVALGPVLRLQLMSEHGLDRRLRVTR